MPYILLKVNAPFQSYGVGGNNEWRDTTLRPTRSAITGLLCAALGCQQESREEKDWLDCLNQSEFQVWRPLDSSVNVLQDFQTLSSEGTTKIVRNQYLVGERLFFYVVLHLQNADRAEKLKLALLNPQWVLYAGKKCCLLSEPIFQGVFMSLEDIQQKTGLLQASMKSSADGVETRPVVPISFKRRQYANEVTKEERNGA